MPTNQIRKDAKESGRSVKSLESDWEKSKKDAPKKDGEPNWAIVETIYKNRKKHHKASATNAIARLQTVLAADPTKHPETPRPDRNTTDNSWWENKSPAEQDQYLKDHPNSERVHLYKEGDENSGSNGDPKSDTGLSGTRKERQEKGGAGKGGKPNPKLPTGNAKSFRAQCQEFLRDADKVDAMAMLDKLRLEKDAQGEGESKERKRFEVFQELFNAKYNAGGAGTGYKPSKTDRKEFKGNAPAVKEKKEPVPETKAEARLNVTDAIWDAEGMNGRYETAGRIDRPSELSKYLTVAGVRHKIQSGSNFAFVAGTVPEVTKQLLTAGWQQDKHTGHLKFGEQELFVSQAQNGATIVTDLLSHKM